MCKPQLPQMGICLQERHLYTLSLLLIMLRCLFLTKPSESWAQGFCFSIKLFRMISLSLGLNFIDLEISFYLFIQKFVNVFMLTVLASGAKIINHTDMSCKAIQTLHRK